MKETNQFQIYSCDAGFILSVDGGDISIATQDKAQILGFVAEFLGDPSKAVDGMLQQYRPDKLAMRQKRRAAERGWAVERSDCGAVGSLHQRAAEDVPGRGGYGAQMAPVYLERDRTDTDPRTTPNARR